MNSPRDAELLRELHALVDRLLDEELSSAECQRLEELVCTNQACSDHYVRVMQMNAGLTRGAIPELRLGELPLESSSAQENSGAAFPVLLMDPLPSQPTSPTSFTAANLAEHESGSLLSGFRQVRDWTVGHWQLSAGTLIASCILALLVWNRSREARVLEGDRRPPVVNSLQSDNGTVTIALDQIGTVTIEGPTDFRMVGPLRARLNYGNITVHVTEPTGHGFVVETPDGDVTDFGTKFTLNVAKGSDTKLIVREGSVDLRPGTWKQPGETDRTQRLIGGQAVSFNAAGNVQRIMSIVAMQRDDKESPDGPPTKGKQPLITGVSDNLRDPDTRNFYEIVPQGLREDAVAYVDRAGHQWNGIDKRGMPAYLLGADYVKPFNDDKLSTDVEISVTLSRPAKMYVFFDERLAEPEWLLKHFRKTGDRIGLDMRLTQEESPSPYAHANKSSGRRSGVGPGKSVDHHFAIWERTIDQPGSVTLGPKEIGSNTSGMYGIAAVEIEDASAKSEAHDAAPSQSANTSE
jgi:hypothetical protein